MSSTLSAAGAIKRVNWWHERIVDWELMNPQLTMGDCALHFGKSETWISRIRNSDAFNEFRDRRIAEHQDMVSTSVIDKTEILAKQSLDLLHTRIREEQETIALSFVKETAEMALKALGYSRGAAAPSGAGGTTIFLGIADPDALARAREKLRLTQNNEQARLQQNVITAEAL